MSWKTTRLVEFQHCDPAGIVFYPRYFEMINSVIEEYFRTHLGYSFAPMHFRDRRGVPTVKTRVEFHAPSHLEDTLEFTLSLIRLGHSSVTLKLGASCCGKPRLSVETTLVRINLDTKKSDPWPTDLAEKIRHT